MKGEQNISVPRRKNNKYDPKFTLRRKQYKHGQYMQ